MAYNLCDFIEGIRVLTEPLDLKEVVVEISSATRHGVDNTKMPSLSLTTINTIINGKNKITHVLLISPITVVNYVD